MKNELQSVDEILNSSENEVTRKVNEVQERVKCQLKARGFDYSKDRITDEQLRLMLAVQGAILNQCGMELLVGVKTCRKPKQAAELALRFLAASRESLKSAASVAKNPLLDMAVNGSDGEIDLEEVKGGYE